MDDDDVALLSNHNVIQTSTEYNENKSIESVREWFIWSYLNVIIGAGILGFIAIGCSLRTEKFKRRENYSKANKWSYVTFFVNFIITLSGLTIFGYLLFRYFHNITMERKLFMEKQTTDSLIHPK